LIRLLASIALLLAVIFGPARAHEVRPAYLSITETGSETYSIFWKVPAMGELRLALYPRISESAVEVTSRESVLLNDSYVERWSVHQPGGLSGETISIDGLAASRTDVLVSITRLDGEASTARLTPADPSFVVPASTGPSQVAAAYLRLGVEHILLGIDHLLFVLALLILVRGWKRLAVTITAFTAAHSITLAAAVLGFVNVPGPPVEAMIALSIALVAAEIVNLSRGRASLTARSPWLVAFAFGLLHGLGFAGALTEIGLPAHAIPIALLFFNVGVELGQVLFVAVAIALAILLRRTLSAFVRGETSWSRVAPQLAGAYSIGGIASFWFLERVSGFWT
jgi:hydrogenase/urease accessory protein HupE